MNLQNKHKFVVVDALTAPSKGALTASITPRKGALTAFITPRKECSYSIHYAKVQNYLITL